MKPRILIVDDDHHMVRTFRDIFALGDWDTDGAFSGEEALDAVDSARYDVVLMDIRMTGMNGVETLTAIRKRQPGLRVILMTAYSAPSLVAAAQKEGALAIMSKPVQLPSLMEKILVS